MNPGDIVYHKATNKRCVIAAESGSNTVKVTTSDGESKIYYKAELMTETEWLAENGNEA